MPDDMFFSDDERALVRGRRARARTEACRPCLVDVPGHGLLRGVILNLTPHGVLLRLMEQVPLGTACDIQMMRDEEFAKPLSPPRKAIIVREDAADGTFFDIGAKFDHPRINRPADRPARVRRPRGAVTPVGRTTRMHTLDIVVGDEGPRYR